MVKGGWSITRAKVLRTIKDKEPLAIHELVKKTGIARSTLLYHLEALEEGKLIKTKKSKALGTPIVLTTNKANPSFSGTLKALELLFGKS